MGCGASSSQTREGCQAWIDDDGLQQGGDGLRACAVTPPLMPTRSNRLRLSRPAALEAHSAARRQVQVEDDAPIMATELSEAEVLWLQQEELRGAEQASEWQAPRGLAAEEEALQLALAASAAEHHSHHVSTSDADVEAALKLSLSPMRRTPSMERLAAEQDSLSRALEESALEAIVAAQGSGAPPRPRTPPPRPPPRKTGGLHERLTGQLRQLDVGQLRKRAAQEGVDAAQIEAARDGADPKQELTALIVCQVLASLRSRAPAAAATTPATAKCDHEMENLRMKDHEMENLRMKVIDALRFELRELDLEPLSQRAVLEGVAPHLVDQAKGRTDVSPQEAIIALVVAQRSHSLANPNSAKPPVLHQGP